MCSGKSENPRCSKHWAVGVLALFAMGQVKGLEIKVATILPDGSHWLREMRSGGDEIRVRTDGRVTLKFYPGGVMGNDAQILRKVRIGQLHGGAFTATGLGARYSGLNVYGIPLLFRSLDEVDYVRERMDAGLVAGLEDAGFVSFGFTEGGFAQLMANDPISRVEDMRRRKVWIPEGDQISSLVLAALGLSPVTLPPTDVLTGLQTGLIDVVAASPVAALVLQWHTKIKHITELPIVYSIGIFAIDVQVFNRLSEEDQAVVREILTNTVQTLDKAARQDEEEARAVLGRTGIQFVSVDPGAVMGWRRTIDGIYPKLRQRRDIDAAVLDELLSHLRTYRSFAASTRELAFEHPAAQ